MTSLKQRARPTAGKFSSGIPHNHSPQGLGEFHHVCKVWNSPQVPGGKFPSITAPHKGNSPSSTCKFTMSCGENSPEGTGKFTSMMGEILLVPFGCSGQVSYSNYCRSLPFQLAIYRCALTIIARKWLGEWSRVARTVGVRTGVVGKQQSTVCMRGERHGVRERETF